MSRKDSLIILRHLPPNLVPRPVRNYFRASSELWERIVGILVIMLLICWLLYVLAVTYTGNATRTTVNISSTTSNDCNFTLSPGMNYVSFNCVSTATPIDLVFSKTNVGYFVAMYEYERLGDDRWKVYNPHLPNWTVQDLSTLSRLKGYIIWMNETRPGTVVNYNGYIAGSSTIPVYNGYNLVGYPSIIVDPTTKALTTINDTFTNIRTYNLTRGWIGYRRGVGGNLTNLTPNEGYWINMSVTDSWILQKNRTAG